MHVLQRLTGHSSITTTREFYLQAPDANDRTTVSGYETLLEAPTANPDETCVRFAYGDASGGPARLPIP